MTSELEALFTKNRLRLTTPRQLVFHALKQSRTPLAIADIIKQCSNVDRVSIYRTIDLFTKLHIVQIVPMGWKQLYELTSPFAAHHHHLYCVQCHRLIDIHSAALEQYIQTLAREHEFTLLEHSFEVTGVCKACQK